MNIQNFVPNLSWGKINTFLQCKRCFYKEQVLKKKRPGIDANALALNSAVDVLLKKEFDYYRQQKKPHPIMQRHNIDAVPYSDSILNRWRDFRSGGISYTDPTNNIHLSGIVDDIWINPNNELIIVDYKATSEKNTCLDSPWAQSYQQQLSYYSSLLRSAGYKVHNTGYLFYNFPLTNKTNFAQQLAFQEKLQACELDDSWLEPTLSQIRTCLNLSELPEAAYDCLLCKFDMN